MRIGAASLLLTAVALAQADRPVQVKGADLELLGAIRQLAERIESFRDRAFARKPLAVRAPEVLRQSAAEIAAAGPGAERLAARGRAWADLGLSGGAAPSRLRGLVARDLDGIALDPTSDRLLVDPARLTREDFTGSAGQPPAALLVATGIRPDEPVAAHVLMHLMQRQTAPRAAHDTTDAWLADAAWREGEANFVAVTFVYHALGLARDAIDYEVDPGQLLEGALLPSAETADPAVTALAAFVYQEGFAATAELVGRGGWPALDRAVEARRTTRDLLHLDREPREPERPASDPETPAGQRLVDRDVLGEQGIIALVARATGKDNLALIAGDGWRGDALYRYEPVDGPEEHGTTVWWTSWDDAAEARLFAYAAGRTLAASADPLDPPDAPRRRFLRADGRMGRLELDGRRVLLRVKRAIGAPDTP